MLLQVKTIDILAAIIANSHVSTRDIACDKNISQYSVLCLCFTVLYSGKINSSHISVLQELWQNNFNMKIQFCVHGLKINYKKILTFFYLCCGQMKQHLKEC